MRGKALGAGALLAAVALVASACGGGSSGGGGGGQGGQGGQTVTIGLLTSTTGEAAPGYVGTVKGAKARIKKANETGELGQTKLKLVVGDDASSPSGSLTAAKDLVANKDVSAVLSWSAFTYGAYRYLERKGIPVVGSDHDGPEWGKADNMFAIEGYLDPRFPAPTTWGKILKSQGVTKLAILGFGSSPSSTANVKNWKASAKAAGIKVPYVNLSIPFGSTDMGSIALGVKNSGADGIYSSMVSNSNYAMLTALQQQGVHMKAAILPTGYGQSLLDNKTARKTAQGALFYTNFKPVGTNDPAVQQWQADLKKYAGFTGVPTFGISGGWLVTDALIAGLKKVQGDVTPDSIMKAMPKVTHWTAGGLGAKPRDFSARQPVAIGTAAGNCDFVSELKGSKFVPINDGEAYCGKIIPNSYANPNG